MTSLLEIIAQATPDPIPLPTPFVNLLGQFGIAGVLLLILIYLLPFLREQFAAIRQERLDQAKAHREQQETWRAEFIQDQEQRERNFQSVIEKQNEVIQGFARTVMDNTRVVQDNTTAVRSLEKIVTSVQGVIVSLGARLEQWEGKK